MDDKDIIDAIKKAIKRELKTQKLYMSLYKKATTQNAKALFETLACEEQKHEMILKAYLECGDAEEARKKVEIYSQGLDLFNKIIDTAYDSYELRAGMKFAVNEERKDSGKYRLLYKKMYERKKPLALQNIFNELMNQELKHEGMIKAEYVKLFGFWDE